MKRTVSIAPLAFFLLLALSQAACNLSAMHESFDKEQGKEVLAKAKFDRVLIDSTGELQIYASMNRSTELHNKDAVLRFADPYKELYLLVFKEEVSDFKAMIDLSDSLYHQYEKDTTALLALYSNLTTGNTRNKLQHGKDSLLSARTLHGMEYRAYAVTGTYNKIPLFYLNGMYKSRQHFYQVVVWTPESRRNLYEGIMRKMAESLQEGQNNSQ